MIVCFSDQICTWTSECGFWGCPNFITMLVSKDLDTYGKTLYLKTLLFSMLGVINVYLKNILVVWRLNFVASLLMLSQLPLIIILQTGLKKGVHPVVVPYVRRILLVYILRIIVKIIKFQLILKLITRTRTITRHPSPTILWYFYKWPAFHDKFHALIDRKHIYLILKKSII